MEGNTISPFALEDERSSDPPLKYSVISTDTSKVILPGWYYW